MNKCFSILSFVLSVTTFLHMFLGEFVASLIITCFFFEIFSFPFAFYYFHLVWATITADRKHSNNWKSSIFFPRKSNGTICLKLFLIIELTLTYTHNLSTLELARIFFFKKNGIRLLFVIQRCFQFNFRWFFFKFSMNIDRTNTNPRKFNNQSKTYWHREGITVVSLV